MRAAIYARVSTDEQANKDNSIPAQIRALRTYCKRSDISIYKEYIDEGISGQKENRPAFQQMLSDAYSGRIDIILVHKFHRFARRIELSRKVKTELHKSHVNVVSITEPIEDSPMGFFMEGLHELMAEYYVKNLSAEVKKEMNERALKGKHMGQMPYGYYCKQGEIYVNENQAEVVRKIYSLYMQGYGQLKIARYLNAHNLPTYKQIGEWGTNQISKILKNPKYIGKNIWDGQVYDADFPAIIDEDLFDSVIRRTQMQSEHYSAPYRGDNFAKFPLLEILYCGECGSPMRIKINNKWNRQKEYTYTCRNASMYRNGCTFSKLHSVKKVESTLNSYLEYVLSNSPSDLKIIEDKPIDASDLINKKLIKINSELSRAKSAYIEGVFELGEYKDLKETLEKKIESLEKEITANTSKANDEKKRRKLLNKMHTVWDLYLEANTANEKRELLKKFIKRVDVFRDRYEVIFYV